MKYLMIHKLIWIILVLLSVVIEMIMFYGIYYIIYVLWNFKFPKNWWKKFHEYYDINEVSREYTNLVTIIDKNPWETIKRRYHIFFN